MKSVNKSTLLFLLVIIVLLMITGSFLAAYPKIQENFAGGLSIPTTSPPVKIRLCPLSAPTVQTSKGYTDCCTGELINGKCNGAVPATLSPSHDGILTAVDYWKGYFSEKGRALCPGGMPNYYDDVSVAMGVKGCSASVPSEDGKGPRDTSMNKCMIYPTQSENELRANSCYNEKLRESLRCPILPGHEATVSSESDVGGGFKYFTCRYQTSDGLPSFCAEDKTFTSYLDRTNPNWKISSNSAQLRSTLCSQFIETRREQDLANKRLAEEKRQREIAEKARDAALEAARRVKEELAAANARFQSQIASWRNMFSRR